MSNSRELDTPARYEILVKGSLDISWLDWFDGFTFEPTPNDETMLRGPVLDQAALHGLLAQIRDLGLPLLSVTRLAPEPNAGEKQSLREPLGHV